jgi:hypothetical protein
MGEFAASGQARTFDYQAGDVGFVPFATGHYIENTGTTPLRFLEIFKSSDFADVSLNQWLALTPPELVQAHLKLDPQTIAAFQKEKFSGCAGLIRSARRHFCSNGKGRRQFNACPGRCSVAPPAHADNRRSCGRVAFARHTDQSLAPRRQRRGNPRTS